MPQSFLKNLCETKKLPIEYWENTHLIINDLSLSLEQKIICLQSLIPNQYKGKILEIFTEWVWYFHCFEITLLFKNKHCTKLEQRKLDYENRIKEVLKQPVG